MIGKMFSVLMDMFLFPAPWLFKLLVKSYKLIVKHPVRALILVAFYLLLWAAILQGLFQSSKICQIDSGKDDFVAHLIQLQLKMQ
jgi:hypothetical protein